MLFAVYGIFMHLSHNRLGNQRFCIILRLLKKEVTMTSRTLLRKAAGNIKKDLKNSRTVMVVNESDIPTNSITSFKERAYKSAYSYPATINKVDRKMIYDFFYNKTTQKLYTVPDSEIFNSLIDLDFNGKFILDLMGTTSKEDLTRLYKSLPEKSKNFINKKDIPNGTLYFIRIQQKILNEQIRKYEREAQRDAIKSYKTNPFFRYRATPEVERIYNAIKGIIEDRYSNI